jgi:rhamnosyltransferase
VTLNVNDRPEGQGGISSKGLVEDVLVVVVTFNPAGDLLENLHALCREARHVLVIDNASDNIDAVERTVCQCGCELVRNDANLGIATALSMAARMAEQRDLSWLGTFDQDSMIRAGALRGLLDQYAAHPSREKIAIVAPSRRDRASGQDYHGPLDVLVAAGTWRSVRHTITSGSLIRTAALKEVGGFDDKLFIDAVDTEICLRVRKRGYFVVEFLSEFMDHSVGAASKYTSIPGVEVWTHNYSPVRRYYITRNNLEVGFRYLLFDTIWCLYFLIYTFLANVFVLANESERGAKLRAMLAGGRDFLLRRFGPRRER